MSATPNDIDRLVAAAEAMEDNPVKVGLLNEAVRLADAEGDLARAFDLRIALINASVICQPEITLVAFSWCMSQCDRLPERFPERRMLWNYRRVIHKLPLFPQVSRAQIEELLADMAMRYRRAGSALRGVHLLRRNVAVIMGDVEAAAAAHLAWRKAPNDWLGDSAETELNFLIEYLAFLRKDRLAIQRAGPVLSGKIRTWPVPHNTFAEVLMPMVRLGRWSDAMECHLRGYQLTAGEPYLYDEDLVEHLLFLALTGNHGRAVNLLEKLLPVALAQAALASRFLIYHGGRVLCACLLDGGPASLSLRLPKAFPLYREEGHYETAALLAWLTQQMQELAAAFDARNGNAYFSQRIAELPDLLKMRHPLPLPDA